MSPLFFFVFLSLALDLRVSPFFSLSFAGLPPTFSFSLSSLALYSKFVCMKINLGLIRSTTRIQKQFLLSVFVFIDPLVVTRVTVRFHRQNNLDTFGLPYLLIELLALVCLWCGRTVSRSLYGHVITKFSGIGRLTNPWCSSGVRFARERELRYKASLKKLP